MVRLERLILLFAVLFTAFLILPAFLNAPFPPMPLMDVADVFDVLTPLVLLPLYWMLLQWGGERTPTFWEYLIFVFFAALWAQGQGMHLGANSIGHLAEADKSTPIYALTHFYDEGLGHYLWHLGIVGLAGLLVVRQWRSPLLEGASKLTLEIIAAVIYGITTFIITIEAGTVPLGLPFALVLGGWFLWRGRARMRQAPLVTFFGISYLLAAIVIIGWGIYWKGFPQFSDLGIIH